MNERYDSMVDAALIKAVLDGDRDAGACLYYRHVDRVHRICSRIVLDPSQVADCVQEVWCKVFRQVHRFKCDRSFEAWINCVTTHVAIDYYRKHLRRKRHLGIDQVSLEILPTQSPADGQQMDQVHYHQCILDALQGIAVKQRTAFMLRYLEGMTNAEIAVALGCREGTVRTHIQRCLASLRKKFVVLEVE